MPGTPGITTTQTYQVKEIRSIQGWDIAVPATIAAPAADLAPGTVLGKITASGKLKAYAAANTDGSQTAIGILKDYVPASTTDVIASVYIAGVFTESMLVGLDAAAKTSLGARSAFDGSLIVPA